jgi:hypothetical protein
MVVLGILGAAAFYYRLPNEIIVAFVLHDIAPNFFSTKIAAFQIRIVTVFKALFVAFHSISIRRTINLG